MSTPTPIENDWRAGYSGTMKLEPVLTTAPSAIVAAPVGFGPQSYAGYGTAAAAFILAVLAFLAGDHSEQTTGAIVGGAVGLVALVVTSILRVVQARENAKTARTAIDSAAYSAKLGTTITAPEGTELAKAVATATNAVLEKQLAALTNGTATIAPAPDDDLDDDLEADPGLAPQAADLPTTDADDVPPDTGDADSQNAKAIEDLAARGGVDVPAQIAKGNVLLRDEVSVAVLAAQDADEGSTR